MGAGISLGRVWGIPIALHWSLLLVFGLLTWSRASSFLPQRAPSLGPEARWALAAVTSVLFFGSILLHELGHAWVALRNGVPVNRITLFIFGGAAEIGQQAPTPGAELRIAAGGPAVSVGLAIVFKALELLAGDGTLLDAPLFWLFQVNLMLLLFNLIPGYPLDGGRILRAVVWQVTGSAERANAVAAVSGQLFAFGLMGLGAFLIVSGNFTNGLWLIFIGWFLQNATAAEQTSTTMQRQLAGVTVGQVMNITAEPRIPSRMKVQQLIDDYALARGHRIFLIIDDETPRGLVTLQDLPKIPRERWAWASVTELMTPWSALATVTPTTDLAAAMQVMADKQVGQLPVVTGDQVVGLLTREEIIQYLRTRMEIGGSAGGAARARPASPARSGSETF